LTTFMTTASPIFKLLKNIRPIIGIIVFECLCINYKITLRNIM
jgi:hypothetical protein